MSKKKKLKNKTIIYGIQIKIPHISTVTFIHEYK